MSDLHNSFGENIFTPPPITDQEYNFICTLVYEQSRIKLGEHKRELVMARLGKRLRKLGLKTYGDYCHYMRSPQGTEEMGDLIDAISTNHTFFFRENEHFDYIKSAILPTKPASMKIWSAACSSGEEAYSIAVTLAEHYGAASAAWGIDCTDISHKILKKASDGIFAAERLQPVPPALINKYFLKGVGDSDGYYQAREEIRRHITFKHLNLLGSRYTFPGPYDIIFCRNVMIYFDKATQNELVNKMLPLLRPGGWLFIGHAESLTGTTHNLKMIKPAIYQKP